MTITPQTAKVIKAIVTAHADWVQGVISGKDVQAAAALVTVKQALDDYKAACPQCGAPMIHTRDRKLLGDMASTFSHCPTCRTTVTILTPPHGK